MCYCVVRTYVYVTINRDQRNHVVTVKKAKMLQTKKEQ